MSAAEIKTRSYCLVSSLFEPAFFQLGEKRDYVLGRDAKADVFLPARQVSRKHAKLAWSAEDGGFVLRDLWSRRGFLVNGTRVDRRILRDDDEITIEPYKLRFRVYEGDVGVLLGRSERPKEWRLAGRTRGAELLDLVAYVDVADISAVLKIDSDSHSGKLTISGSQIVNAEAGFLKGTRAAHALLMADPAGFELRAAPPPSTVAAGGSGLVITQVLSEILGKMGTEFVTAFDATGVQESDILRLEKRLKAAEAERQLRALGAKRQVADEDVARARELQRAMLRPLMNSKHLAFTAHVRPAGAVGGVVHDVIEVEKGRFRVLAADVAGGPLEAAMGGLVLKAEYDRANDAGLRSGDVASLLSRRMEQRGQVRFQATVFDVVIEDGEARVTLLGDDLPPLVHCHDGQAVLRQPEVVSRGETVDLAVPAVEAGLSVGDRLLVFTHALAKQKNPQGQELGTQRLLSAAARTCALDAPAALQAILAEVDTFRGAPPDGDLALLAIDVL